MTQALVHSLNIGTLATWLSLAGFGAVGVAVKPWEPSPGAPAAETLEMEIRQDDFLLGGEPGPQGEPAGTPVAEEAEAAPEPIPTAPPEMPSLAETQPLPEIPELPSPAPAPTPSVPRESPPPTNARPSSRNGSSQPATRPQSTAGRNQGSPGGSSGTPGARGGQGGGLSNAARLAKGRMPAPSYPAAARRAGQTGTVIVDFTVDANGTVISAAASRPSPWPLLNHEAVRTVRRWKFPPGGIMKLQRPIVFQLR